MHEKKEIWYKISFIFQFSNHNFIIWYQLEKKYIFWLTFWALKLELKIKEIEIFLEEGGHHGLVPFLVKTGPEVDTIIN